MEGLLAACETDFYMGDFPLSDVFERCKMVDIFWAGESLDLPSSSAVLLWICWAVVVQQDGVADTFGMYDMYFPWFVITALCNMAWTVGFESLEDIIGCQ